MNRKFYALIGCALVAGATALAGVNYIGEAGSDWTDGANWEGGVYPVKTDTYLDTESVIFSAVPTNISSFRLGSTADAVLNVEPGAVLTATSSSIWGSWLGISSGFTGTINQTGGSVSVNELEVGSQAEAYGIYNQSGGSNSVTGLLNGYSLYIGGTKNSDHRDSDGGYGTYTISGGTLLTRAGVALGHATKAGVGIFRVMGTGPDEIGIGTLNESTEGSWFQHSNSVLQVGISANGITPILIDDANGDLSAEASFGAGSILDVSFIDGAEETNRWPVMICEGIMVDLGLSFDDSMGAATNDWGFIISNNTLWVGYGLDWPAGNRDELVPASPDLFYANMDANPMEVVLNWEAVGGASGYHLKRSTESGVNYSNIAENITGLTYADSDLEANKTYYYVLSAVNVAGESSFSEEVAGVGFPYAIFGDDSSYLGASPWFDKGKLFDNDVSTFFDSASPLGGWIALDFGEGNEQQIKQITYVMRDWNPYAVRNGTNTTFEGANSADFTDAVLLHTVPQTIGVNPMINSAVITDSTYYRYVRIKATDEKPLFSFAEVDFLIAADFTSSGTPKYWLDAYGLVTDGDYETADQEDRDADGLKAWEEYVAGTDPTDAASVLAINSMSNSVGGFVISWQSVEGKNYSIVTNASLSFPNPGVAVSGILGLASETSVTSSIPSADTLFIEIAVE
ncbi:MAG: fibronectin type III domain-containing protein [Pontiella sp.]